MKYEKQLILLSLIELEAKKFIGFEQKILNFICEGINSFDTAVQISALKALKKLKGRISEENLQDLVTNQTMEGLSGRESSKFSVSK